MRLRRAAGEGSVFSRVVAGKVQWIAQTPFPECRRFTSMKSQSAAVERRTAYLKKKTNIARITSRQLVTEYLADWLASQDVRSRTRDGYRSIIEKHITPPIGTMRVRDVGPQHVQFVLNNIASRWMRWQAFRILRSAFRLLAKWKKIEEDPTSLIDAPSTPDSVVVPMSEENFHVLIKKVKKDRLAALWLMYLTIGPRRGEAIALSKSTDVNLRTGTVTFRRSLQRVDGELKFESAKTPSGNRTLKLPKPVLAALKTHLVRQKEEKLKAGETWQDNDLVFTTKQGMPLEPRNVTRRWHQLLTSSKVPKTKLHNARHTVVSMLLREGVDIHAVQAMAGHSKPSVTTDIYGHLISGPNVAAEAMERVMKRK